MNGGSGSGSGSKETVPNVADLAEEALRSMDKGSGNSGSSQGGAGLKEMAKKALSNIDKMEKSGKGEEV